VERWCERVRVPPVQVLNWFRRLAAFLGIEIADLDENASDNLLVGLGIPRRIQRFVLPLEPSRRVDEGAILFCEIRSRQEEDLCLDIRGSGLLLVQSNDFWLPEGGGFGFEILRHH